MRLVLSIEYYRRGSPRGSVKGKICLETGLGTVLFLLLSKREKEWIDTD